jgi:hypothetical protein
MLCSFFKSVEKYSVCEDYLFWSNFKKYLIAITSNLVSIKKRISDGFVLTKKGLMQERQYGSHRAMDLGENSISVFFKDASALNSLLALIKSDSHREFIKKRLATLGNLLSEWRVFHDTKNMRGSELFKRDVVGFIYTDFQAGKRTANNLKTYQINCLKLVVSSNYESQLSLRLSGAHELYSSIGLAEYREGNLSVSGDSLIFLAKYLDQDFYNSVLSEIETNCKDFFAVFEATRLELQDVLMAKQL